MVLKIIDDEPRWYINGLRFECTGCGECCTGAPGYVWVDEEEIAAMADFLNIPVEEFSLQYLRKINGRISLKELPKSYDCVFLKNKKCQIYAARPTQCKTFPWWPQNLKSENEWLDAAQYCEGIRFDSTVVPFETIETQRLIQEAKNKD